MSITTGSSTSLPIGVRNSYISTSIESFEATVAEKRISRRTLLDLNKNSFVEKLIFYAFQSDMKFSSSLSRDAVPLILRNTAYFNLFIEIFWLCYHRFAVLSTQHESEEEALKDESRTLWHIFLDLAKKRLSPESLKRLISLLPEIMATSVTAALAQLFPSSMQFLSFLNYESVCLSIVSKLMSEKTRKQRAFKGGMAASSLNSQSTSDLFAKSFHAVSNRRDRRKLRPRPRHRSKKREPRLSSEREFSPILTGQKPAMMSTSKYFEEHRTPRETPAITASFSLPSLNVKHEEWHLGFSPKKEQKTTAELVESSSYSINYQGTPQSNNSKITPGFDTMPADIEFQIRVFEGKDIIASDAGGKSDPYCKILWSGMVKKTKTINACLNPSWDEEFVFETPKKQQDIDKSFKVQIYDQDLLGGSELIGCLDIPIKSFYEHCNSENSPLHRRDRRKWVSRWYDLVLPEPYSAIKGGSSIYLKWTIEPRPKKIKQKERAAPTSPAAPSHAMLSAPRTMEATPPTWPAPDKVISLIKGNNSLNKVHVSDRMDRPSAHWFFGGFKEVDKRLRPTEGQVAQIFSASPCAACPLVLFLIGVEARLHTSHTYRQIGDTDNKLPGDSLIELDAILEVCRGSLSQIDPAYTVATYILSRFDAKIVDKEIARLIASVLGILASVPEEKSLCISNLREILNSSDEELFAALYGCHGLLRTAKGYEKQINRGELGEIHVEFSHSSFRKAAMSRYLPAAKVMPASALKYMWDKMPFKSEVDRATNHTLPRSIETQKRLLLYERTIMSDRSTVFLISIPAAWYDGLNERVSEKLSFISDNRALSLEYGRLVSLLARHNNVATLVAEGMWEIAEEAFGSVHDYVIMLRKQMHKRTGHKRVLVVRPIRAENLLVMDGILGTSDPYLVFYTKNRRFESREIKQTISPIWDQDQDEFVFTLRQSEKELRIRLFDRDAGFEIGDTSEKPLEESLENAEDEDDDPMGTVIVRLDELVASFGQQDKSFESDNLAFDITHPKPDLDTKAGTLILQFKLIDIFPYMSIIEARSKEYVGILSKWLGKEQSKTFKDMTIEHNQRDRFVSSNSLTSRIASVDGNRRRLQRLVSGDPTNVQELLFLLSTSLSVAELEILKKGFRENNLALPAIKQEKTKSRKFLSVMNKQTHSASSKTKAVVAGDMRATMEEFCKAVRAALDRLNRGDMFHRCETLVKSAFQLIDENCVGSITWSSFASFMLGNQQSSGVKDDEVGMVAAVYSEVHLNDITVAVEDDVGIIRKSNPIKGHPDDSIMMVAYDVKGCNAKDTSRCATMTEMYKCISIVDLKGNGKKCAVSEIPLTCTATAICQCGNTPMLAVATRLREIYFFVSSNVWDVRALRLGLSKNSKETWEYRYKISMLPRAPCAMIFDTVPLPCKTASGTSTLKKDMMWLATVTGDLVGFILTQDWRIKCTELHKVQGGAAKDLLQENYVLQGNSVDDITGLGCSESGTWIHKKMHYDRITQVTYFESYGAVFTSSIDGTIKMQSIKYERTILDEGGFLEFDGRPRIFCQHEKAVHGFTLNEKDGTIISFGMGRDILHWSPKTLTVLRTIYTGFPVRSVKYDYFNDRILVLGIPRTVEGGDQTQLLTALSFVDCQLIQKIQFSHATSSRAGAGGKSTAPKGEVFTMDVDHGIVTLGLRGTMKRLAILRDWAPVGSVSSNGAINGDPGTGPGWVTENDLVSVLYSKTYSQILTCDNNGRVEVWDIKTGCHLYRFDNVHTSAPTCKCVLNDAGTILYACGMDGAVSVRHGFNGEMIATLEAPNCEVSGQDSLGEPTVCAHLILNGKPFFVVGSTLGKLAFWELPKTFDQFVSIPRSFTMLAMNAMITGLTYRIKHASGSSFHHLATIDLSGRFCLWNASEMAMVNAIDKDDVAQCICRIPSTDLLLLGYSTGMLIMVSYEKDGFELFSFDAEVVVNNEIGKAEQTNQEEQILKKEVDEEGVLASGVSALYCTASSLFASVGNGFIRCWNILKIPHDLKEKGLWDSYFKTKHAWKAHDNPIDTLHYDSTNNILIMGSRFEKTVSLWTQDGICIGKFGSKYVWKLNDVETYLNSSSKSFKDCRVPLCGEEARQRTQLKTKEKRRKKLRIEREMRKKQYLDLTKDIDDSVVGENFDSSEDEGRVEGQQETVEKPPSHTLETIRKRHKDKELDWNLELYRSSRAAKSIQSVPGKGFVKELRQRKLARAEDARLYEKKRFKEDYDRG